MTRIRGIKRLEETTRRLKCVGDNWHMTWAENDKLYARWYIQYETGFDFSALNKELGKRGAQISDGYGPFKGKTFRIGHMGDLTLADCQWLTGEIDDILKS